MGDEHAAGSARGRPTRVRARLQRRARRVDVRAAAVSAGVLALALAASAWGAISVGRNEPVAVLSPPPVASPSPSPSPVAVPDADASDPADAAGDLSLDRRCGAETARLVSFAVHVEPEIETTGDEVAAAVLDVLCDDRSWIASGRVRFAYDPEASLVIAIRSPESTERRCLQLIGRSVGFYYSCAGAGEVVLNADRWFGGSELWAGPPEKYRALLVNHEVGHVLGLGHRGCRERGAPAPVMMQQSKGLAGCAPNPWPTSSELRSIRG